MWASVRHTDVRLLLLTSAWSGPPFDPSSPSPLIHVLRGATAIQRHDSASATPEDFILQPAWPPFVMQTGLSPKHLVRVEELPPNSLSPTTAGV
ncbi:hypothetical protein F5X68DRAFT_52738 [Plectosphaerella plurivora]|uniref:Uncharacterized protein n=1 Tax=Plectosphaerella plurivora TaxID=936078 RepID=A0A9P8V2K8_9PEZI|nr:hypothetical protein F5X68DRAFT_52738 [Plectosphaerella plurivora]